MLQKKKTFFDAVIEPVKNKSVKKTTLKMRKELNVFKKITNGLKVFLESPY